MTSLSVRLPALSLLAPSDFALAGFEPVVDEAICFADWCPQCNLQI
jgi:hypothetical protein